jgi:putative ABC transport system permease protein
MDINAIIPMLASVIELASIYSLVTLGLVFSFRMVGFADLTIESSFTTGAAVCAILVSTATCSPAWSLFAAAVAGGIAGTCTALLHVKGRISRLLSGIIMMTVLYSVNLQIMGKSNIQLVSSSSLFDLLPAPWRPLVLGAGALILFGGALLLLRTHFGYLLRTCGESPQVVTKLGHNSGLLVILALAISNALTSFSGAIAAQYFGYADVGMSTGLIVAALASLILGEAICSPRSLFRLLLAALVGSLLYRLAFEIGLRMHIHPWNLKIAVGLLLAGSLVLKQILGRRRGQPQVGVEAL